MLVVPLLLQIDVTLQLSLRTPWQSRLQPHLHLFVLFTVNLQVEERRLLAHLRHLEGLRGVLGRVHRHLGVR